MKIYRMAILTLLLLVPMLATCPVFALDANSIWIEPPSQDFSTNTPVGTTFNVTVWLNVTSPTDSWQFYLIYDGAYLNALRCGYTGNGKSLWSGTNSANSVDPAFGSHNATSTYKYVLHGEVLKSSVESTGEGSLSWVEFNVTAVPPAGQTVTSDIRLDVEGPFSTQVLNANFEAISPALTFGKSTYVIPEFPLTALLFALFIVTASLAFVFRKRIGQTLSY